MADLLANGCSWLMGQLRDNASQTVTLKRGGKLTTGVKATKCPVRSSSENLNNEGLLEADWIIAASQYVVNGQATQPNKNDVLEESDGQQWSVLPLTAKDESQPFDPYGNGFRIRTKQTKAAD